MDETLVDAHGVEIFTALVADRRAARRRPDLARRVGALRPLRPRFARALNAADFAAVALDHRRPGHTAAVGPRGVRAGAAWPSSTTSTSSASRPGPSSVPTRRCSSSATRWHADRARLPRPSRGRHRGQRAVAGSPPTSTAPPRSASCSRDSPTPACGRPRRRPAQLQRGIRTGGARRTTGSARDPDEVDKYIAGPDVRRRQPADLRDTLLRPVGVSRRRTNTSRRCRAVSSSRAIATRRPGWVAYPTALSPARPSRGASTRQLHALRGCPHELLNEDEPRRGHADIVPLVAGTRVARGASRAPARPRFSACLPTTLDRQSGTRGPLAYVIVDRPEARNRHRARCTSGSGSGRHRQPGARISTRW